ncbi:Hypothetical protein NTJ_05685 [Nesidiocoris tenuis]|uniref:Uncharacterized protein n=1 Tax=Nesidiocoris tenuis TaxID=355587 RepID=A0ABN7AKX2_9HEMI|nr:Hypothetical protein NTJ_05685 [Nesidiocoris tenuis]
MGCGQSHIAVIYPRKSKHKDSSPQSEAGEENSDEERNNTRQGNENEVAQMEEIAEPIEEEDDSAKMRQMVQLSNSPLLAHQELSTSQSEFFKMLDDKIDNGPDYKSTTDFEFAMDHSQLCRLLQEWQAAKHKSKYGQAAHQPPKLQKFHSVQSNGELPGMKPRLSHQSSLYSGPPPQPLYGYPPPSHYDPYQQMRHYQPPPQHVYQPPPPQAYQHHNMPYQTPPSQHYAPPAPPPPSMYGQQPVYHHTTHLSSHHMGASSVVMYDKRGGYYTELA